MECSAESAKSIASLENHQDCKFCAVFILIVLYFVLAGAGWSERDVNLSSSTRSSSLEYVFIVNSVCIFRGEDKAPGARIETAHRELYDKLMHKYEDMRY
uniref:Uncharacterized protein n=1 Tax=Globisporangium ultimum (strain ATCC 200006 / CBS 805.95 / DAOM BR144) TaxID=431595 RepID=K3WXD5_GLOUD